MWEVECSAEWSRVDLEFLNRLQAGYLEVAKTWFEEGKVKLLLEVVSVFRVWTFDLLCVKTPEPIFEPDFSRRSWTWL